MRNVYTMLFGKPERKRHDKPSRRWEYNIEIDL